MWVIILICNVALAILCWRVVVWMLRFRLAVIRFRQTIVMAEENCRSGLGLAPESLWIAHSQLTQFRQWQHRSKTQWTKVRQGWTILLWGQRFLQFQSQWRSRRNSLP